MKTRTIMIANNKNETGYGNIQLENYEEMVRESSRGVKKLQNYKQ